MPIRQGRKVTELTALNSASLNTYVVGVDNNVTYKISLDVLENAIINIVTSSTDSRLNALEQSTASFYKQDNSNPEELNYLPKFTGNKNLGKSPIFVTGSRVIIGGPSASSHPENPEALAVYSQLDGYNLISGHGMTNNYLQLNIKNFSNLSNASSDVVATADNGTENSYYVNMGINGSGYDEDTIVGLANDTYVYGYGNIFHIGNAAELPVYIFAGGFDAKGEHLKMVIDPENNHTLTGSLNISGGISIIGNQYISGTIEIYDTTNNSEYPVLLQKDSDGTFSISNGILVPADGIRIPGGQSQLLLKNDANSTFDTHIDNINEVGLQISASGTNDAIMELIGYSLNVENTLTASINEGFIWVGNSENKTHLIPTSSFDEKYLLSGSVQSLPSNLVSSSQQITDFGFISSSQTIDTTVLATTGSNIFVGKQILQDESLNSFSIYPFSGSLILIGNSYNSASNHISASSNDFINLIFKDSDTEGSTIISGSNNLIKNPNTPTNGFVNYIKDGNIALQGHLPQLSASMQFPIDINGNILNAHSNVIMRGPSTATYWTINANYIAGATNGLSIGTSVANNAEKLIGQLTVNNNVIQNSLQIIANNRPIEGASMVSSNSIIGNAALNLFGDASLLYTQNYVNGTNQFTTHYSSGSAVSVIVSSTRNTFSGNSNNVTITGSYITGSTTLTVADNATFGASNTLYVNTNSQLAYKDYLRTIVGGSNLIVSGSNWASDTNNAGTIVLGRNNVNDGIRNKTRENILIVGTGTSTTNRKTGFLIDSGSNIFVEGTFNVSGSSNFNGNQHITGSLIISGSGSLNGDNIVSSNTMMKIETISSASYAEITPVSGTLYIIIG